jgi:hypothetical protein
MKRVEIISTCLIAGETLFQGSVVELDDDKAVALITAQRGKIVDDKTKLRDTSKEHLAEADQRAQEAVQPGAAQADVIAKAVEAKVAEALAKLGAAAAPAADTAPKA